MHTGKAGRPARQHARAWFQSSEDMFFQENKPTSGNLKSGSLPRSCAHWNDLGQCPRLHVAVASPVVSHLRGAGLGLSSSGASQGASGGRGAFRPGKPGEMGTSVTGMGVWYLKVSSGLILAVWSGRWPSFGACHNGRLKPAEDSERSCAFLCFYKLARRLESAHA